MYTRHLLFPFLAQTWPLWWKMHFLVAFKESEHAGIQQVLQVPPSRQMCVLPTKSKMQFSSSCCIPHADSHGNWMKTQFFSFKEKEIHFPQAVKYQISWSCQHHAHCQQILLSLSGHLIFRTRKVRQTNNATRPLHSWTNSSWGKQHLTHWPCSPPLAPLKFPVGHC